MAETTVPAALTEEQWDADYFAEYVRDNRFKRYMGTTMNSVIQIKEDLTKKRGDGVTIPLVTRLTGGGVTGTTVLEGSEEELDTHGHKITVDTLRNGVVITDHEEQFSSIDYRNAAKEMLRLWSMEKLRDGVIDALGSIGTDGSALAYASATEVNKDAWLANNSDRVLFGAAKSNNAANDHSAALANVDTVADTLDAGIVSLAKRMAKTADPHIRPIRTTEDEEWFVMFAQSLSFRDLKNDSTILQANREAWQRGRNNPIFRDGDLLYDGVIIREVPEISVISSVGASSADVAPNYLCGAQSVGVGWAKRPKSVINNTDYEFRKGVGVHEMRGIDKLFFNSIQHGIVTVYTAGAADS